MDDEKIIVERLVYSPDRDHAWQAVYDTYDGAPDAKDRRIGFGATPIAAVADLLLED